MFIIVKFNFRIKKKLFKWCDDSIQNNDSNKNTIYIYNIIALIKLNINFFLYKWYCIFMFKYLKE